MDRLASIAFFLYLLLFVLTGAKGQQSQCENGWFGDRCQYQCHCLNGAVCDKTTGDCPGDCDREWFGPQCQYRDAAYKGSRSYLVDGILSTCLPGSRQYQYFRMTHDVMFTWMRIVTNKPGVFDKVEMTFYLRSGAEVNPKSALTSILVNATILELYGKLQDRLRGIGLTFDTPETRQSFCTMQVSSNCYPGFYGPNCTNQCSEHCGGDGLCNNIDGRCVSGCKPGYRSYKCEQDCPPGLYGQNCRNKCSEHCGEDGLCNNIDGTCLSGCKPGYRSYNCKETCPHNTYGQDCSKTCSMKCVVNVTQEPAVCGHETGQCLLGCVSGYSGITCEEIPRECDLGFFGYNCIFSCPENCRNKSCNKVDGLCIECEAGYHGPRCAQVCDATFYGQNCATPCSGNCIDQLCHHITGECEKCPYGKQISKDCFKDCEAGFHGFKCLQPCPENCQDNICDNAEGTCTKCVAGYQGLVCNQECDATFYGEDCSTQCSDKCIDQLCHHINGVCDSCPDGKQISNDCSQDADQLNLAIILVPVILVLIVVAALIVGIWLWRKRKAQKANSRMVLNNENKDGPDVVLGHGVNLELEDNQTPNVPEETTDHYDRISFNVNEGNPDNNENENTSRYVNVENPALNEYERTGENRESHVYTEPED